jgi:hypothetical protein
MLSMNDAHPRSRALLLGLASLLGACTHAGGTYQGSWSLQLGGKKAAPTPATPPPPGACLPEGGGPHWIEEGETLTVNLMCGSGRTDAAFAVDGLPEGAIFDAASSRVTFSPRLDQAAVYRFQIAVPSTGESAFVQVGVADRFDHPANVGVRDPVAYAAEAGLPVMHLVVDEAVGREDYKPATITYRGHVYSGEAKLRGRSSLEYPKRNYTLKFAKADPFNEPELGGGLTGRRRLALITTFDDNSYIRHRLAFELWNRLEPTIKLRHFSTVLYVNGRYQGLFVAVDHVDEDLFGAAGLSKKGNLYKALDHVGNFLAGDFPDESMEKKDGKPPQGQPGSHDDLRALFDFIANADLERFRREAPTLLHLPDYRAWMIAVLSMQATDTLGKNAYHYHDPAGGPWRVVIWDFNASFGQNWDTRREISTTDLKLILPLNRLFMRLWDDPVLGPETKELWRQALAGPISRDVMLRLCEQYGAESRGAALRDERRWRKEYLAFSRWADRTDLTDFNAELGYVCRWIGEHWTHLQAALQ